MLPTLAAERFALPALGRASDSDSRAEKTRSQKNTRKCRRTPQRRVHALLATFFFFTHAFLCKLTLCFQKLLVL